MLSLMLQNLGDHIKNCLERASDVGRRAKEINDAGLKADVLNLEKQWLCLAQSYMLCERIERFLVSRTEIITAEWLTVSGAPFDRDLELAVIDETGMHALAFPCHRILGGWINAQTMERLDVRPTHWREWKIT